MPNGRLGDHPLTDILYHGSPVFTPEVDDLIRRIARLAPGDRLDGMLDWFNPPPPPKLKLRLEKEMERLLADARARGQEIE